MAAQVIGNDAAITVGGLSGAFELNVYIPMMARNLLESFTLLANVSRLFAERCIDGLVADEARLKRLAESSPSIVTPLNSAIGYEEAAAVAKEAPQGAQDDSADGHRSGPDRRQALRGGTRQAPRRPGDGEGPRRELSSSVQEVQQHRQAPAVFSGVEVAVTVIGRNTCHDRAR